MNLAGRDPNSRHQTVASAKAAGVDASAYWDFVPGQRVITAEGIAGSVVEVVDGPVGRAEIYVVTLDDGLGGGKYGASELRAYDGTSASVIEARDIQPEAVQVISGEIHLASDDYPELTEILVERPPLERTFGSKTAQWVVVDQTGKVTSGPHPTSDDARDNAGPGESVQVLTDQQTYDGWATGTELEVGGEYSSATFSSLHEVPVQITAKPLYRDHRSQQQLDGRTWLEEKIENFIGHPGTDEYGQTGSVDWCRFRRSHACWYPKELDQKATEREGYAVWVPFRRGICERVHWDEQKACELAMPGPLSGEDPWYTDATIPYEEGGQRGAIPVQASHSVAAWKDVQAKAKRIRSDGGVRVIAATEAQVTAQVQGDEGVYETSLLWEPGKRAVAMWECSCPWAAYSWGRSGRWKKYEGRMCAHALALSYEAQAQEFGGGTITEDTKDRGWEITRYEAPAPSDWQVSKPRAASVDPALRRSLHEAMADGDIDTFSSGQYRGRVVHLDALIPGVGVRLETGEVVPAEQILHPLWHPYRGLHASRMASFDTFGSDTEAMLNDEPEPALPQTDGGYGSDYAAGGPEYGGGDGSASTDSAAGGGDNNPYMNTMTEDSAYDVQPAAAPEPTKVTNTVPNATTGSLQQGLEWLMGGSSPKQAAHDSADIAAAAKAFLETGERPGLTVEAGKHFTHSEQMEIINEGEGVRAANFASLDIAGTHYEAIAASDDDDIFG